MSEEDSVRDRGKAQMRQVYGWDIEPTKPFEQVTVDHLFGEVWAQGKLSVRDRRLVLIGLAAGGGLEDVATLQLDAAMNLGELDAEDLRTLVVFLAHYAGWPRAAKLNSEVENLITRHEKAAAKAAAKVAAVEADTDAGPVD
ncbi:carboxymuconolactone decarboxylase family protein [soil metagenome]